MRARGRWTPARQISGAGRRTKVLEGKGDRVLRYWNNDVPLSVEGVLEDILSAITTTPTPHPLPTRGRGADRVRGKRAPSRAGWAPPGLSAFRGQSQGQCKSSKNNSANITAASPQSPPVL